MKKNNRSFKRKRSRQDKFPERFILYKIQATAVSESDLADITDPYNSQLTKLTNSHKVLV